jgi:hypothetical protein
MTDRSRNKNQEKLLKEDILLILIGYEMKCKPILGFSRYSITKDGKTIRNIKTGNEMKQHNIGDYFVLNLYNDENVRVSCRVNRLVALTYIPNPENLPVVNHKNTITTDNRRKNLEWTTHVGNSEHSEKLGLRSVRTRSVVQMDLDGNELVEYDSITEASRQTGIDTRRISAVCKKVTARTRSYRWRYKDDEEWEIPVRKNCKGVEKLDLSGNVIQKYKSMGDAIKDNSISTDMVLWHAIDEKKWSSYNSEPKVDPLFEETRNWESVEGYNGRVSKDGQIYSDKYRMLRKLHKNRRGYLTVSIGKIKTCPVHQIVAKAYLPNPHNYPCVNHIDGKDKTNNSVENLEWTDQSINIMHAHDTGLLKTRKPVIQYDKNGNETSRFKSIAEAANSVGISSTSLSRAARGITNISAGFIWRFEDNPLD